MKNKIDRRWLLRILDFINPLRDPSLTVAVVLTFIEEAGAHDLWYWIIAIGLVNWLAVRGVVWLVVNFTFASTFVTRRLWWAMRHPRLAWRILDAVGHEEIIIGGLPTVHDMMGMNMAALGASGIQVLAELPAGTEIPMLGLPNGQSTPDLAALANSGFFTGATNGMLQGMYNGYDGYNNYNGQAARGSAVNGQIDNNGFYNGQTTDGLPQSFPHRPSEEEERLRQQVSTYARLLDDWIAFTEEKWRTVSDSQLGWKPLRGRWGSWDDIFQDAYAAKTSDPMAQAAQVAGEATSRRYDSSKEKGSAASAVACFLRDMMTLRRGLEMVQSPGGNAETPTVQPAVQPSSVQFAKSSGPLKSGLNGGGSQRSTFIRKPAQIFVDADAEK